MAHTLDETKGRLEIEAITDELTATRARLRALLAKVTRTRGFRRSEKALAADVKNPVSLPFVWAGPLDVAIAAIEDAIGELRASRRRRRRG